MSKILKWLGARAKEPSTWTGLATVAVALGLPGATVIATGAKIIGAAIGGGLIGHTERPAAPTTATAAG